MAAFAAFLFALILSFYPAAVGLVQAYIGGGAVVRICLAVTEAKGKKGLVDQIEIVKGWIEAGGTRERVVRVVGEVADPVVVVAAPGQLLCSGSLAMDSLPPRRGRDRPKPARRRSQRGLRGFFSSLPVCGECGAFVNWSEGMERFLH